MHRPAATRGLAAFALTIGLAFAAPAHASIEQIGAPTLAGFPSPEGVNSTGVVAGSFGPPANRLAFRFENGRLNPLYGTVGSVRAEAADVNNGGAVVGTITSATASQAVVWPAGANRPIGLGYLPGGPPRSFGYAINDKGQVAGTAARPSYPDAAGVLFNGPGGIRDLQPGAFTNAFDVNNGGVVLGSPRAGTSNPFLSSPGSITTISCLSGVGALRNRLNDGGTVVGQNAQNLPARWRAGVCTPLPLPGGYKFNLVRAINNAGTMVGNVANSDFGGRAVIWPAGGGVKFLDDVVPAGTGWKLTVALDISDAGHVIGTGEFNGRDDVPFLYTPDLNAPRTNVSLGETQKLGGSVGVEVRCNERCRATAGGSLTVSGSKAKTGLEKVTRSLRANRTTTLKPRLSANAQRTARRALARRKRVRVAIKVVTRDKRGNSRTVRRAVMLRR